jgi:hypothetical protein
VILLFVAPLPKGFGQPELCVGRFSRIPREAVRKGFGSAQGDPPLPLPPCPRTPAPPATRASSNRPARRKARCESAAAHLAKNETWRHDRERDPGSSPSQAKEAGYSGTRSVRRVRHTASNHWPRHTSDPAGRPSQPPLGNNYDSNIAGSS